MDDKQQQPQVNAGATNSGSNDVGQAGQVSGEVQPSAVSPQQPTGGASPEHEPVPAVTAPESVPIVEVKEHEIPPEVQEFVEKVDKENLELGKEVVHQGQPVVQPSVSVQEPSVMLPLTQTGLQVSMKKKVSLSARWLAEWCMRIIKKFHGRVFYASGQQDQNQ